MPRPRSAEMPFVPSAGLAIDLDRTLVHPGRRPPKTARIALHEARAIGLKVILVSGRTYGALAGFVKSLGEIDALVAENGAVIEAPRGRRPVVVGRQIARVVRQRLRSAPELTPELGLVVASLPIAQRRLLVPLLRGLEVSLIENVDRVMILPKGVTKASGVRIALAALGLEPGGFAAIGDGENDVPMLREAAVSGAVSNATAEARRAAGYLCRSPSARGVAEFVRGPLAAWRVTTGRTVDRSTGPRATSRGARKTVP